MPRKASGRTHRGPAPSFVTKAQYVFRDSLGRFAKRGAAHTVVFVERDERGRFVSGIEKFLRDRGGYTEQMISRIKEHRGISKQLRMKWDLMADAAQPNKYATRIKYKGVWYSREKFEQIRENRITQMKMDYYQMVLGLSRREARSLFNYIQAGRNDNPVMNMMRKKVGSDPKKRK